MDYSGILKNKYWVIVIAIFCSVLWGSAFPVLKISFQEMRIADDDIIAKIVFAGIRFFMSSIFIFIFLIIFLKKSIVIKKQQLPVLFVLGLSQTTLQYFFFYNGLTFVSGTKGSIISSIGSFFVVLIAHFFYKDDKINRNKVIGLISGFGGIILINWGKDFFDFNFTFKGEGFLILSAFVASFGTILAKELTENINPFLVTAWQIFLGSSVLLLYGLPQLKEGDMIFTGKAGFLLIYSAFLSAASFSLWYSLLKYNKAGEIEIYKFMIPVSGAILSSVFISSERFTLLTLTALLLVALGIIAINADFKIIKESKI